MGNVIPPEQNFIKWPKLGIGDAVSTILLTLLTLIRGISSESL